MNHVVLLGLRYFNKYKIICQGIVQGSINSVLCVCLDSYVEEKEDLYRGNVSRTIDNHKCLHWQFHEHYSYMTVPASVVSDQASGREPPEITETIQEAGNSCRYVSGEFSCYTQYSHVPRQQCAISQSGMRMLLSFLSY